MLVDQLTSLIQEKYTLTRNEMAVLTSIFKGSLKRDAILFITNINHNRTYRG